MRQSGLGAAKSAAAARAMLVEAAWAAAKAPGPLHAFFVRIRAKWPSGSRRRCSKEADGAVLASADEGGGLFWARPSLVAHKTRSMELQAGRPQKKGNSRGPTMLIKELQDREMRIADQPRGTTSTLSRSGARPHQMKRRAGASKRPEFRGQK